jgi:probable HAF family extracellular repeat protein
MWFSSWLGKRPLSAASGRRHGSARKRPTCRPQLEALEERTVPSGGYHFKTITNPNAGGSPGFNVALGINSRGDIVGGYADAAGAVHGYLRSGGEYTTLDDPNAAGVTDAIGINARGQIVGFYNDASGHEHGFLRSHGQYTTLNDPNSVGKFAFTDAFGINARGQIVGDYIDASGAFHGFLLSGGQYTTLDDPNANRDTRALGINTHGEIVGTYRDASGNFHGFLLRHGHYTTLDDPNARFVTSPTGINDRGQIVGGYLAADSSGEHGFLLSGGQYTTLDDPNAHFGTGADGITDSGKIVGFYIDASGNEHGFLATKAHDDEGDGDDAPARTSIDAGRVSGGSAQVLLPAALTNATLTANHVMNLAGDSGGNRTDGLSSITTGPTWAAATVPSSLPGSGDSAGGRVPVVSAAGKDTGQPGNDVFARNDDVFRVDL